METRKCKACELVKSLDEFSKAGLINGVQYHRYLCIPCYSISKKPRKEKIREQYYEIKKNLKCEKCGNDDYRVLEFDHIDREAKSFNVSDAIRKGYALEKIKHEIEKCQVLCANCHRIKTWEENIGV